MNASLGAHGIAPLGRDEVVGFSGNGARQLVGRAVRARETEADESRVTAVLESFATYYAAHCLDRTRLYPGIEEVVRVFAERRQRMAVLTNKPRAFSEEILVGLGVRDSFSRVIGGDDLGTRKPDPEGLLTLVADAGCRPADALMVGDNPFTDGGAAHAGIATLLLPPVPEGAARGLSWVERLLCSA